MGDDRHDLQKTGTLQSGITITDSSTHQLLERMVTGWASFPPPLTLVSDGDGGYRITADGLLEGLAPVLTTTLTYIILPKEYIAPAVVFVTSKPFIPSIGAEVDYDVDICSTEYGGRFFHVPELHVKVLKDDGTAFECIRFFNHIPRDRALFNLLAFSTELNIIFACNGKISSSASVTLPDNNNFVLKHYLKYWNSSPCPPDLFHAFSLERLKHKNDGSLPAITNSLDYLMFVDTRELEKKATSGDVVLNNTIFQVKEWLCNHFCQ
ncbi:MAG: hypothetical protein ACFFD4_07140 [Candidatus Odinarchaeota archaeon]